MNSQELARFADLDEQQLSDLTSRYVRNFRRPPSPEELERFHRARTSLRLRLPHQARRRVATLIATL